MKTAANPPADLELVLSILHSGYDSEGVPEPPVEFVKPGEPYDWLIRWCWRMGWFDTVSPNGAACGFEGQLERSAWELGRAAARAFLFAKVLRRGDIVVAGVPVPYDAPEGWTLVADEPYDSGDGVARRAWARPSDGSESAASFDGWPEGTHFAIGIRGGS